MELIRNSYKEAKRSDNPEKINEFLNKSLEPLIKEIFIEKSIQLNV